MLYEPDRRADWPAELRGVTTPSLPRWAQAADLLTAALVVVGAIVAVSGGFQARLGSLRFAVTSPVRLGIWAAIVAVVRAAFAPRPTAYAHVRRRVLAWIRAEPARAATLVMAGTRPAVLAVGYLAVAMFGYAPGARPFHEFDSELLNLPLRWDAGWYLQIAANGYEFLRDAGPDLQQNVVFFPGYPLTVRAVALLFGNTMAAYVAAAQLVSVVCFWIALAYLHELAVEDVGAGEAVTALWLIAAYPFALFFGAIYSESLYLAAAVGAVFHLRRSEPGRAAAWAFVAGVTRPNGFLLSVPLAFLAFRRRNGRELAAAAMPLAGVAAYSLYVWHLTGTPIAWMIGHQAWNRHYEGLAKLVVDRYDFIAHSGFQAYASQRPYDLLNAAGVVFVASAAWGVLRRFGAAYALFLVVNIVPPLTTGGLMSAGRFTSVLFPAFLWLGSVVPERHRSAWIATFASMQALTAALFYTWRPLY